MRFLILILISVALGAWPMPRIFAADPPLTRGAKAALPSGPGLAARYPGDIALASDPRVLLVEDFESGDKVALKKRWEDVSDKDGQALALIPGAPPHSPGQRVLEVTARLGHDTGGHLYRRLPRPVDRAFARFLVRFDETNGYTHNFLWLLDYVTESAGRQNGITSPPILNRVQFDHVVVAEDYIGPILPVP
jgi:hypothetical protein